MSGLSAGRPASARDTSSLVARPLWSGPSKETSSRTATPPSVKNRVANETIGTSAVSIVRTDSGTTHGCWMSERARFACHVSFAVSSSTSRLAAFGIAVVVRTFGRVTTKSTSEPGRIRPVA